MAINIFDKYGPTRANAPTTDYPVGSVRNESVPGANDGTPLDEEWGNDYAGFDAALFAEVGIIPDNNPDTAQSSQRLSAILQLIANERLVTQGDSFTIGATGDFTTITDALRYLTIRSTVFTTNNSTPYPVILTLQAGFVMQEQVFLKGQNLGHVQIDSVDPSVTIERSFLVADAGGVTDSRPAFAGINGSVMPVINVLFDMDTSGDATRRDGMFLENSKATVRSGKGFRGCGEVGIYANAASEVQAEGVNCDNCLVYGFFSFRGSSINCENGRARNCGEYGLYVNRGSTASANGADFQGAGVDAVRVVRGSTLAWENGIGFNCGGRGIYAIASTVHAVGADVSNSQLEGIFSHDGASVAFRSGKATNCGQDPSAQATLWAYRGGTIDGDSANLFSSDASTACVLAQRASTINVDNADCSQAAGTYGIRSSECSTINARDANAQKGGSPSSSDCSISNGGIISFIGGTGGTSHTVNTIQGSGIIFG